MQNCLPFLLDPRAIKLEHAIRIKNRTIALIVNDRHFRINVDDIDEIQMVVDDANEQNQQQIGNEEYINFGGGVGHLVEQHIDHDNGNIANGVVQANADNANMDDGIEQQMDRASDTFSGNIEFSVDVSFRDFTILSNLVFCFRYIALNMYGRQERLSTMFHFSCACGAHTTLWQNIYNFFCSNLQGNKRKYEKFGITISAFSVNVFATMNLGKQPFFDTIIYDFRYVKLLLKAIFTPDELRSTQQLDVKKMKFIEG